MGKMGCPRCLLVWPVPGEKLKHAQSWCLDGEKEQGQGCIDPVLCLIDPHLCLVACLFSPSHKFPLSHLPSKLHAHCLCPSQCHSVSTVLARARRCCLTPSPIKQEMRDTKYRLLWRQQCGLTPSFGCCDGKCKCVTGVHSFVWERREGFILQLLWFLSGCKWCWSPWVVCITAGKQTSQVSSQTVHEKTIKQLNKQCGTKGQEFYSHGTNG